MSFEMFDNISPKITLFYNTRKKHTSFISAVISLVVYLCLAGLSFYFIYDFITNSIAKAYYFIKFTNDTGVYSFDPKGLYHVITFENYDSTFNRTINIIGIQNTNNLRYMEDNNPLNYDHWIYEYCNIGDGINEEENILINQAYSKEKHVFCITKFYNKTTKIITEKKNNTFKYPTIEHGTSNPNLIYYGIIIQKCQNNILNNFSCNDDETMNNNIIKASKYSVYFLDNYVDLEKSTESFYSFLTKVSTVLSLNTYTVNNLNYYSLEVKTHSGFLFDSIKTETSFRFVTNEKIPYEIEDSGVLGSAYFFMQNRKEVYERAYKKIQDLAASLGGVSKMLITIGEILNYFINDFVVANDFFYELQKSKHKFNKNIRTGMLTTIKKINLNTSSDSVNKSIDKMNIQKFSVISPSSSIEVKEKKKTKRFSFIDYCLYKVNIQKKALIESILKYRKKIISEENLCQMYLYIKMMRKEINENKGKFQRFSINEKKDNTKNILTINSVK